MKKFNFTIHGNKYEVEIQSVEENIAEVEVNGSVYKVEVDKVIQTSKTPKLVRAQATPNIADVKIASSSSGGSTSVGGIKSPLPGVVLSIHIKVGETIKIGQKLMVLEAMKMENNIDSDKDGIVKSIKVNQGDSVMEGDLLIEIGG